MQAMKPQGCFGGAQTGGSRRDSGCFSPTQRRRCGEVALRVQLPPSSTPVAGRTMAKTPQKKKKSTSAKVLAGEAAVGVILLSFAVSVTITVLRPLFGSVPTTLWLYRALYALLLVSTTFPLPTWSSNPTLLSIMLCIVPPSLHKLGLLAARTSDPRLGPFLAYVPALAPVVFVATNPLRKLLGGRSLTVKAISATALMTVTANLQRLWNLVPATRTLNQPLLLVLAAVMLNVPNMARAIESRKAPRRYLLIASQVVVILFAVSTRPVLLSTPPYMHDNGLMRLLSSVQSTTGQIVVADDYERGFRFLRADHSLLGGLWIGEGHLARLDGDKNFPQDKNGTRLGDSIYSTFVLQEAARFQVRDKPQKDAVIIGLGAGVAAQAFMQHGLETSIVEIDQAVYDAALHYFGVQEPSAVFIEDARGWAERQASLRNGTYDIIVHDCFSGGGVPSHIFTMEFWASVKQILDPEGIVAVNFAGVVGSSSSKAVLLTLEASFGQCRVFHDYKPDVSVDDLTSEFINLVFFCSPSSRALEFRTPTKEDYLSSYLREYVFKDLAEREIDKKYILDDLEGEEKAKWILTDTRNPLGAWQDAAALDHFKVMRSILPDYVWETY